MTNEDEPNYFAPPESDVTATGREPMLEPDAFVRIRREYMPHEMQVRALSQYVFVFCGLFGAVGLVLIFDLEGPWIGLVTLLVSIGFGAVGVGLLKYRSWARLLIFAVSAVGMGLLVYGVMVSVADGSVARVLLLLATSVIPWWAIWLTATPAASLVFSPQYREVIRRTRKLRPTRNLTIALREGFALGFGFLIMSFWLIFGLRMR